VSFGKLAGLYLITTVAFFAFDFVWLSTATKRIYQPYLGDLLLEKPNLPVAAVFYLFYIVGLIALAIIPGLQEASIVGALWRGALFGAIAYATYDLTNLATLNGWAWQHGGRCGGLLRGDVARHQVAGPRATGQLDAEREARRPRVRGRVGPRPRPSPARRPT
jgi:uncharacterized membrane protein